MDLGSVLVFPSTLVSCEGPSDASTAARSVCLATPPDPPISRGRALLGDPIACFSPPTSSSFLIKRRRFCLCATQKYFLKNKYS